MIAKRSPLPTAPIALPAQRVLNKPWENVGDFWNDPRRWEGIEDSHKTLFWTIRRPDVIDVREKPKQADPALNAWRPDHQSLAYLASSAGMPDVADLLNIMSGSLIRYGRAI